ncbi:MAG TPA: GAF domain-containing protein, partial [Anaeromyxobacter sp.]
MTTETNLLRTLERILAVEATELRPAMVEVCNLVGEAFGAEKVDVFFLESDVLVAVGTSETPLGAKQKALGLDRLPVASGGRAVRVLESGQAFATPDSRTDPLERRALVEDLGIRSAIFAALDGDTRRRGVLAIASPRVGAFEQARVEFARAVARWVSLVAHRADLADEIARRAREEGRRTAADELVTVLAHDFRNYLQPIAARFELIRRRAGREGRVRDRDDVDSALTSVRRLVRLVEDLLDI